MQKSLSILSIFVIIVSLVSISSSTSATVTYSGLLGYWPFTFNTNEVSGSGYFTSLGGTAPNILSNCILGLGCANVTTGQYLPYSMTGAFNGSYTVSFWDIDHGDYNPGGDPTYFGLHGNSGDTALQETNAPAFFFLDAQNSGYGPFATVNHNQLTFYSAVCGDNGNFTMYANATVIFTTPVLNCLLASGNSNIFLYTGGFNSFYQVYGQFQQYTIYNRSLSFNEEQQLFNQSGIPQNGSSGGNTSINCSIGQFWNGTNCVINPAFRTGNFTNYPNVYLQLHDTGCYYGVVDSSGGLGPTCSNVEADLNNEDWVFGSYQINNRIALPAGYNQSFNPNIYALDNATCYVGLATNFIDYNNTLVYDNPALNPGAYHDLFSSRSMWEQGQPLYSIEVTLNSSLNGGGPWKNLLVNVTCTSDVPNTTISDFMQIADAKINVSSDTFAGGNIGGPYTGSVTYQSGNYQFLRTIDLTGHFPYTAGSNGVCLIRSPQANIGPFMQYQSVSNPQLFTTQNFVAGTYTAGMLLPGNYLVQSYCYQTNLNGIQNSSNVPSTFAPAVAYQTNFAVNDICNGNYSTPALQVGTFGYSGQQERNFVTGEDVSVQAQYTVPQVSGNTLWTNGACFATITNITGTPTVLTSNYNMIIQNGVYTANILSNHLNGDPTSVNYGFPNGYDLSNGTYLVNITCANSASNFCIAPVESSLTFNYNTSDTCQNVASACTLNGCQPCPNSNVTCENGVTYNPAATCVSRTCVSTTSQNSPVCQNPGNIVYTINANFQPSTIPWGTDNFNLIVNLLNRGNPVPPTSVSDLSCVLELQPQVQNFSNGQNVSAQFLTYNVPIGTGSNIQFNMHGNIVPYMFQNGGDLILGQVTCYSTSFSAPKVAVANFYIGQQGGSCFYAPEQATVSDQQCLSQVTNNSLDNPLQCSNSVIVNDSVNCGCPVGMTVNSTTFGCDGSTIPSTVFSWLALKWLTLGLVIFFFFFGRQIIAILGLFVGRNNNNTVVNLLPVEKKK